MADTTTAAVAERFSDEEKIDAFDKIAACFYQKNFGTMAKADIETLLFDIYIEHCLDKEEDSSDYTLSKQLGVNQSRIRTLKVKKELKYPRDKFDWREEFSRDIKQFYYDKNKKIVKMNIADVNVMIELRHFMEAHGWYDEYQLNPKLFQCRADLFVELCLALDGGQITLDDAEKRRLRAIQRDASENEQGWLESVLMDATSDGLKSLVVSASETVAVEALKCIPFGTFAKPLVTWLIEKIAEN